MYRQAIIDAKALRASAIANAKASLQEAFEPKIQEMLRMKLSEELDEEVEEMEEAKEEVEEGYDHVEEGEYGHQEEGYGHQEEGMEEEGLSEGDLDEILAELEAMEEGEGEDPESLNEAEEDDDEDEDEGEEAEGGEIEPGLEDETDEMEVTIKFGELKDLLTPFVTEPEEGGEEAGIEDLPAPEGDEEGGDALSLDEILAELEKEEGEKVEEEKEPVEEAKGQVPGYGKVGGKGTTGYDETVGGKGRTGYDAGSKKLHEANKTIKILSEKLQEINLLNAKLLYMNKIFKSKSLNETQKVRVVKSFDKATSVKEVKSVYEILSEAFSNRSKAPLKESRGFASKPTGGNVGTKKPIVESDPTVDRWQQLVFGNK